MEEILVRKLRWDQRYGTLAMSSPLSFSSYCLIIPSISRRTWLLLSVVARLEIGEQGCQVFDVRLPDGHGIELDTPRIGRAYSERAGGENWRQKEGEKALQENNIRQGRARTKIPLRPASTIKKTSPSLNAKGRPFLQQRFGRPSSSLKQRESGNQVFWAVTGITTTPENLPTSPQPKNTKGWPTETSPDAVYHDPYRRREPSFEKRESHTDPRLPSERETTMPSTTSRLRLGKRHTKGRQFFNGKRARGGRLSSILSRPGTSFQASISRG